MSTDDHLLVDGTDNASRLGDLAVRAFGWRPGTVLDPVVGDRFRWLRDRSRPGARTLDAGCGSGWFALWLASRGNAVTGISFDSGANAAASRRAALLDLTNARFVQGDLSRLDDLAGDLGTFEEIVCLETIEHLPDDQKLLIDLAGLLEPGGRLFLTTPSDDHPELEIDRVAARTVGGHLRFGYSHARLSELCDAAGLRVIETSRLGGTAVQWLFALNARLTVVVGFRAASVLALAARPLKLLDGPLTRAFPRPELCVAIVAERPRERSA